MENLIIQTELLIHRFRQAIPGSTATARSIDRNDSWSRIAETARRDGFDDIAELLERSSRRLQSRPPFNEESAYPPSGGMQVRAMRR